MSSSSNRGEILMLTGVSAYCPDCGDERILVEVVSEDRGAEFCCTTCDAAVLVLAVFPTNELRGAPLDEGRRAS